MIDVDNGQDDLIAVAGGMGNGSIGVVLKQASIGQIGQWIGLGLARENRREQELVTMRALAQIGADSADRDSNEKHDHLPQMLGELAGVEPDDTCQCGDHSGDQGGDQSGVKGHGQRQEGGHHNNYQSRVSGLHAVRFVDDGIKRGDQTDNREDPEGHSAHRQALT